MSVASVSFCLRLDLPITIDINSSSQQKIHKPKPSTIMSPSTAFLTDVRSPKSPKRFFNFSRDPLPPLPPLPPSGACSPSLVKESQTSISPYSSPTSSALGNGAQVVRRPSDARREMRQPLTAGLVSSSSSREDLRQPAPTSAFSLIRRPSQPSLKSSSLNDRSLVTPAKVPSQRSNLKVQTSMSSTASFYSTSIHESDVESQSRRATVRPPPRPNPTSPFAATLLSHSSRPNPTASSHTLVILSFAYSLDDPPINNNVTMPWEKLRRAGGHLVRFIERHLHEEAEDDLKPDMTDGESAEDSDLESDYGLGALLRFVSLLLCVTPS